MTMSSTGQQFDLGTMQEGRILQTGHCYLHDGIWLRCDCGAEIVEVMQADLDDPTGFEYQFRWFQEYVKEEDLERARCVCVYKDAVKEILPVLESHKMFVEVPDLYDKNVKLQLKRSRELGEEQEVDMAIIVTEEGREFVSCEIILDRATPKLFARKLKAMIKAEGKIYVQN